ncbi:MAG: hypothetical protein WA087_00695 [Candidatus Saccharimonadales bacterium]
MNNDIVASKNGKKNTAVSQSSRQHSPSGDINRPHVNPNLRSISQKTKPFFSQVSSGVTAQRSAILRKVGRNMDIARSSSVSRFTKSISQPKVTLTQHQPDLGPSRHPMAKKADRLHNLSKQVIPEKTSQQVKEEAIAEAFRKLEQSKQQQTESLKRSKRLVNTVGIIAGLIFIIFLVYFMYINVPSLSMSIAGAQAGISATYPEYRPDGYSQNGPVSYTDGAVVISFKSGSGSSNFAIKQVKSSWDSTAVKDMVAKDSSGEFITTEERGLTIYSYNGNAAWVNGGILYSISGNASLTCDQIRRIATSL